MRRVPHAITARCSAVLSIAAASLIYLSVFHEQVRPQYYIGTVPLILHILVCGSRGPA